MPYHTYPYELPPLPFPYEALEPYIDAETMYYHHDKHFSTYINNLNRALEPYLWLQRLTLEQLLANPNILPPKAATNILNNGGGVYNHLHFFQGLAPAQEDRHTPKGLFLAAINASFISFDNFKMVFNTQALAVFGSGYTELAVTPQGTLRLFNVKNQDTLLPTGNRLILLVDVWEHAYYLKYKNLRGEYLKNIWNVLVFPNLS